MKSDVQSAKVLLPDIPRGCLMAAIRSDASVHRHMRRNNSP
jgi:hypothetical protein